MEESFVVLTSDQRAAIETTGSVPLSVDGLECVLVRSDIFNRVRDLLGDDWTHDDMLMALARSSKENGWDEPGMELYDEYDKHVPESR
jgi:hypothetical protein